MPPYTYLADLMLVLQVEPEVLIVATESSSALKALLDEVNDWRASHELSDVIVMSCSQYELATNTGWPLPARRYAVEPLKFANCQPVASPSDDACNLCRECFLGY